MFESARRLRPLARGTAARWLLAAAGAVLFAGCAEQRVRTEAQEHLRAGRYETAVMSLEAGLKDYPDSATLRSAFLQARNEALSRLIAEASALRASGRFDEAEVLLRRAQAFDSSGKRVEALLADISIERRQRAALVEAERALGAKQPLVALRLIAEALKDNPRQSELLTLQRRLQSDIRRDQVRAAQLGLAETRPITLDFRDASLRAVLDVVTRHSGVNFVLDKDIRPDVRVTALLRSARVQDAIELIVATHQLAKKVIDSQTVFIYPNTPEKQREHQEQVVRVFYLTSADAKGAAAFLRSMLRIKDPHVDERLNMLAIREPAEVIELAERLVALYDTSDAEVLLELEVLEIRSSRLTDLGIQFPDTIGITALAPSGAAGLTVDNLRGLGSDRLGVSVSGLLISLKRNVGDFHTLANPRIRARNRERARVLIGDKVPVVTSTTGQGGFVAESVNYLDVGLKLDVEPTVYADDEVAIRVSLEVSSLAREVRTTTGGLAYQIGTRSASTVLRLRDGETQVLAGLISNDERSSASRLPGLGDLPLAGRLFSSQRDETQRTELVLAITPRVLRNIRRPEASESEIWVGTDAVPRMRGVGGLAAQIAAGEDRAPNAPALSDAQVPGVPTPSASTPKLALQWRAPSEVKVGDTFLATLELSSDVALRGLPLHLQWSADKLQVQDLEEGEYFRADGAATSFTKSVDDKAGSARAGMLRNHATGATGQGVVVRLRLKATAPGAADLVLTRIEPVPIAAGAPVAALPPPLRVQVKP